MSNDEGDPWDDTALIKAYDAAIAGARGLTIVRKLSLTHGLTKPPYVRAPAMTAWMGRKHEL
jgi:hypothetical protein